MADYITNDPKLTTDGRYVNQGFSDPEAVAEGKLRNENERIMQKAGTKTLKYDGAIGLDAPYTGNDLPEDHFTKIGGDGVVGSTEPTA